MSAPRPPCPSFTSKSAIRKVRLAYSPRYEWRNRSTFLADRDQIVCFLTDQCASELAYRLIDEIWTFADDHIAVRFAYESGDASGDGFRSYGNESWPYYETGLMSERVASIDDLSIPEVDRLFRWVPGRRPDDHPALTELGL